MEVSVEHRVSRPVRAQVALYHREDEDVIRRPDADTHLVAGRVVRGSTTAPFETRLDGVRARSGAGHPARFAIRTLGMALDAYGENRYEDRVRPRVLLGRSRSASHAERLSFLSLHSSFQRQRQVPVGQQLFRFPGTTRWKGNRISWARERNALRLPVYGRLDLRANRTFTWSRRRLTLFAEVINVLNQDNVRFSPPRINNTTRQVTRLFDSLVPVIPFRGNPSSSSERCASDPRGSGQVACSTAALLCTIPPPPSSTCRRHSHGALSFRSRP